jgi:O-antigen/teichoic acid export membrane protein
VEAGRLLCATMGELRTRVVPHRSFGSVVARLTGLNFVVLACAIVTSPILARALGPSGRGEVAAIFAVVGISPWICELGITSFLAREHARRSYPLGVLLGSTMPIALGGSLVGVAVSVPLAHALGRGRPQVVEFVEIGLLLLPLAVFSGTLSGLAVADQRWGRIMLARVLNTVGAAVVIVALAVLDMVTVESVAITYIAFGTFSSVPLLLGLRGSRPWRFVQPVARGGFAFGTRSWLSTIANVGNLRLDQVLMAGLVSSRQLGLYALAATLSSLPGSLVGATSNALVPRVATGDSLLAARACRVTLLLVILFGVVAAATCPLVVPLAFGRAFDAAIPMLIVLLVASVFGPPVAVLGSALIAGGNPSATARGQLAGLIVTVPGLLVLLPIAGGMGAAWVSLAAYGVTFAIILAGAAKTFSLPYRTLLVVNSHDLRWLWKRMRRSRETVV